MANLDRSRIFNKLVQKPFQILPVQRRILERERELNQQSPQHPLLGDHIETFFGASFVFIGRAKISRRHRLGIRQRRMGEGAIEFGGEPKFRIYRCNLVAPKLGQLGANVPIKRSVDLHQIKALRQNLQRMLLAARQAVRIDDTFPVFVRPASDTDTNSSGKFHLQVGTYRNLTQPIEGWSGVRSISQRRMKKDG